MRRDYMTPDKAAGLLDWVGEDRGRRLIRTMFAKEKRLGQEIMIRRGSKKKPHYYLTEPMLRRYCPELFLPPPDQMVAEVRRHLSELDGRMEAVVDERTAPQFEELRRTDAIHGEAIGKLTKHVDGIRRRLGEQPAQHGDE